MRPTAACGSFAAAFLLIILLNEAAALAKVIAAVLALMFATCSFVP